MCSPGIRTASTSASCSDAATICRQTGDRHGEGAALTSLGNALERVRRFDEATTAYQGAAAIFHQTGGEYSERIVLDNLGKARAAQ